MIYEHACSIVTATVAPVLRAIAKRLDVAETDGMFVVGLNAIGSAVGAPATHFINNGFMPVDFVRALKSPTFLHAQAQAAFTKANIAYPYTLAQVTGALAGCSVSDGTFNSLPEGPHQYMARLGLQFARSAI